MKKISISIIILLLGTVYFARASIEKQHELKRINFINEVAKNINEYKKIKGYYPLADGTYTLPVVVYLNSTLTTVDYPIHYNTVTVLDYDVLVKELKRVLGDKFKFKNDPIENYKNPQKYIAKYYATGNQYVVAANLSKRHPLAYHNRFNTPENHKIHNKSKILEFKYFPGFMYRYTINSISNEPYGVFSLEDYLRLEKNKFKIPETNEAIYQAILDGNYEEVASLIKEGVELNPLHRGFNYVSSPLIFAVRNNDFKISKLLIEAGADVNAIGTYEDSVLIYALSQQEVNYDLVELLVQHGADVNVPNYFSYSPFIGACMAGDIKLVNLFLKNGANLNQDFYYYDDKESAFKKGNTPLKAAIKYDHVEVVKILLENNVDTKNGTPGNEKTPLEYAKELGKKEIVRLLGQ